MTFILISGKTNVGKTSVCNKLHEIIIDDGEFTVRDKNDDQFGGKDDFIAHYNKGRRHIVLNSISDDDWCMLKFAQYLDSLTQNGTHPEIIATTIRETDNKNDQMSHMLGLLEAFASGKKRLENYYTQNIDSITSFVQKNHTHHVFVLHLEEKKNKNDAALERYWNYSAETAKQMLDLAVDRL